VDSFLDGRTGQQLSSDQLPTKEGRFSELAQKQEAFTNEPKNHSV